MDWVSIVGTMLEDVPPYAVFMIAMLYQQIRNQQRIDRNQQEISQKQSDIGLLLVTSIRLRKKGQSDDEVWNEIERKIIGASRCSVLARAKAETSKE